jgi:hypothetical protein
LHQGAITSHRTRGACLFFSELRFADEKFDEKLAMEVIGPMTDFSFCFWALYALPGSLSYHSDTSPAGP